MIVLDGSLVLARLLDEAEAEYAQHVLDRAIDEGAAAPALITFEVLNVLEVKRRKRALSIVQRDALLRSFHALHISIYPAPDSGEAVAIASVAERFGLSGYDAAYLELAMRLNAELGTFDRALAEAGRASGLLVHHA